MKADFKITVGQDVLFEVAYTEPSLNIDGSPITDLDYCSVWYSIDGAQTEAAKVTAMSLTGGNDTSWTGGVAVLEGTIKDVLIWATATNKEGKVSDRSAVLTINVDRKTKTPQAPK